MDTTLDRAMEIVNALQMRLFAAAMGFYVLVLTVQVDPFAHYMGAAAFFGLLAIPIRVVLVIVEIADSLTGGVSTSAPAKRPIALSFAHCVAIHWKTRQHKAS